MFDEQYVPLSLGFLRIEGRGRALGTPESVHPGDAVATTFASTTASQTLRDKRLSFFTPTLATDDMQ